MIDRTELYSLPRSYASIPLDALYEILEHAGALARASSSLTVSVERHLIRDEDYSDTRKSEAIKLQHDPTVSRLLIQIMAEITLKLHLKGESGAAFWGKWVEKGFFYKFDSHDVETLADKWIDDLNQEGYEGEPL